MPEGAIIPAPEKAIAHAVLEGLKNKSHEGNIDVVFGNDQQIFLKNKTLTIGGKEVDLEGFQLNNDALKDLGVTEIRLMTHDKSNKDFQDYEDVTFKKLAVDPGGSVKWKDIDAIDLYSYNPNDGTHSIVRIPKDKLSLQPIQEPTHKGPPDVIHLSPPPQEHIDDIGGGEIPPIESFDKPPTPEPKVRHKKTIDVAVAAVKGNIKANEDIELSESRFAAQQTMLEDKGELPKGLWEKAKYAAKRVWKHNWWKGAYESRERVYNLLLHEQANIPTPLAKDVRDRAWATAEANLKAGKTDAELKKQQNRWARQDLEGFFTDVHDESIKVMRAWRNEVDSLSNPNLDPAERVRIESENPLSPARQAWWEASDDIARNVADNLLHTDRGEKRKDDVLTILADSDVGKKLQTEIITPYLEAYLHKTNLPQADLVAREKLTEFFASSEFQTYLSETAGLTPAEIAEFQSRNYATNLLEVVRALPDQVEGAMAHQAGLEDCDFDINLTLGVAEWGPRNKVESVWSERRSKKNQELYQKLRKRENLFATQTTVVATFKERLLSKLSIADINRRAVGNDMLQSEFTYAALVTGGVSLATSQLKRIPRVLLPVFGGALTGGIVGGKKESDRLNQAFKMHNIEEALGYNLPKQEGGKKTQRGEIAERSYHTRTMGELNDNFVKILFNHELPDDVLTPEEASSLLATVVDLDSRNKISDTRNINLLTLAVDDPRAPHQSFEQQKRSLDRLSAQAKVVLEKNFDKLNPEITGGANKSLNDVLTELTNVHSQALVSGLSGDVRYERAMGTLSVSEAQSIQKREAVFQKYRRTQAFKKGTQTGVIGFGIGMGINEVFADVHHLATTGKLEAAGPVSAGVKWLGERFTPPNPSVPDLAPLIDNTPGAQTVASTISTPRVEDIHLPTTHYVETQQFAPLTGEKVSIDNHVITLANNLKVSAGPNNSYVFQPIASNGTPQGAPIQIRPTFDARGQFSAKTLETFHAHGIQTTGEVVTVASGEIQSIPVESHSVKIPGITITDSEFKPHSVNLNTPEMITIKADEQGTYSLHLIDTEGKHDDILASNVRFGPHGEMLDAQTVEKSINASFDRLGENYHVEISDTVKTLKVPTEQLSSSTQLMEKPVAEMGGSRGANGPWGWLKESYESSSHPNTSTNFAKNVFRGWNENYMSGTDHVVGYDGPLNNGEIDYRYMGQDVTFTQLPSALFGADGLKRLGSIVDESYTQWTNGVKPENMDELHRLAYEVGIVGRVATKAEITKLMEAFDIKVPAPPQSFDIHTATIHLTQEVPQVQAQTTNLGLTHAVIEAQTDDPVLPPVPVAPPVLPPIPLTPPPIGSPIPLGAGGGAPEIPFSAEPFMAPPAIESQNNAYDIAYYNSDHTPENLKAMMEKRRSKTLHENPNATLNDYEEVKTYLDHVGEDTVDVLGANYKSEIQRLSSELGQMKDSVKLTVCIPVAGHQEGTRIYESLKNYSYQTADKDSYEIVLFVNHPDTGKDGSPITPDATLTEIERFKADYPDMQIKVLYKVFPKDQAKIGIMRKYATDISLMRHNNRGPMAEPLIIVSNDADNEGVAPTYIQNFVEKFAANPEVDGMLGQLDWDPKSYVQYPMIHVGTRLFQYLSATGRHRSGRMASSGANFAFKSSIYAGIGGYLEVSGGEDINIGRAIIAARDNHERLGFAGARTSRIYTSSRRAIDSLKRGLSPVEQWKSGFSAFDDEIRKFELGEAVIIDYDDPQKQEQILKDIEYVINRTIDEYEDVEKLGKDTYFYKRNIELLGIKYKVENNKIIITDGTQLLKGLKEYQEYGLVLQDVKSGKRPVSDLEQFKSTITIPQPNEQLKQPEQTETVDIPQKPIEKLADGRVLFHQETLSDTSVPSEILRSDPGVTLDARTEITGYFDRQHSRYIEQLQELNAQIHQPAHADLEVAVCIPVAGAQESKNIYHTLESYSTQTMDSSKFEILLFVNTPQRFAEDKKGLTDATIAEISRAQKDFSHLNIRVVNAVLPDDQVKIGNIRKITDDLALLRAHESGITRDILVMSNDADNEGIDSHYLEGYVQYFQQNPDKEGAVGNLQFDPKGFVRFPALQATTELAVLLDKQGFRNGNVDLYGNNSVMKSSIYAAIGGYPSNLKTGEQEWTGDTIRKLRRSKTSLGYAGDQTLLVTTMRRVVSTHVEGRKEQIAFGDTDAEIKMRALDIDTMPMFDFSNPENLTNLQQEIEQRINDQINAYESGDKLGKDSWFYKDNLATIGIVYEIDGNPSDPESRLRITDMSQFVERNKKMQQIIKNGETNMATVYVQTKDITVEDEQSSNPPVPVTPPPVISTPPIQPPQVETPKPTETMNSVLITSEQPKSEGRRKREQVVQNIQADLTNGLTTEAAKNFATSENITELFNSTLVDIARVNALKNIDEVKRGGLITMLTQRLNGICEHLSVIEEVQGSNNIDLKNTKTYRLYETSPLSPIDKLGAELFQKNQIFELKNGRAIFLVGKNFTDDSGRTWKGYFFDVDKTTKTAEPDKAKQIGGFFGGFAEGMKIHEVSKRAMAINNVRRLFKSIPIPPLTRDLNKLNEAMQYEKRTNKNMNNADMVGHFLLRTLTEDAKLSPEQIVRLCGLTPERVNQVKFALVDLNNGQISQEVLANLIRKQVDQNPNTPLLHPEKWAQFL